MFLIVRKELPGGGGESVDTVGDKEGAKAGAVSKSVLGCIESLRLGGGHRRRDSQVKQLLGPEVGLMRVLRYPEGLWHGYCLLLRVRCGRGSGKDRPGWVALTTRWFGTVSNVKGCRCN